MFDRFRRKGSMIAVAASLIAPGVALAQTTAWPDKPVRFILPVSVASTVDIVGRLLAPALGHQLGQTVIIENRPGAGGVIGAAAVAKAPKDGYTFGFFSINHVINPAVIKDIPFETVKDFTPVSIVAGSDFALVVDAKLPVRSVQELIALAKQKPGALSYGSSGNGTVLHLAAAQFVQQAGLDIQHVPYKGLAPMMQDLIGGQIQFVFTSPVSARKGIDDGQLRPIALSTKSSVTALPGLPLVSDAVPGYNYIGWMALAGPANLPAPIVEKMYAALKLALADPKTKESIEKTGQEILSLTPDATGRFLESEYRRHMDLAAKVGLKAE